MHDVFASMVCFVSRTSAFGMSSAERAVATYSRRSAPVFASTLHLFTAVTSTRRL